MYIKDHSATVEDVAKVVTDGKFFHVGGRKWYVKDAVA